VSPSITYNNKGLGAKDITGVFLDPPYDSSDRDEVYQEDNNIFKEVLQWAIDNGDNSRLRIVLCGYEGKYSIPDSWQTIAWKTNGGMANLGNDRGKSNSEKERIYFSPNCLKI
jgi:16S rRNA G966 N2-methylase RsmD